MRPDYAESFSLYTATGRKYLNRLERKRALRAASILTADERLFVLTLAWTGARVSEVLELTAAAFQLDMEIVAIRTLKRRRHHVREVPVATTLMAALERHFHLKGAQRNPERADRRLWPFSRTTAWRIVKRVMQQAGVAGAQACPKGFRHAFGVATLGLVPSSLRQKWMGHARPETTDIYSAVCGPEEHAFAKKFWNRLPNL